METWQYGIGYIQSALDEWAEEVMNLRQDWENASDCRDHFFSWLQDWCSREDDKEAELRLRRKEQGYEI